MRIIKVFYLTVATLIIATGCANEPTKSVSHTLAPVSTARPDSYTLKDNTDVAMTLKDVQQSKSPEREALILKAANRLVQDNNSAQARTVLAMLPKTTLPAEQEITHKIILARIDLIENNPQGAVAQLYQIKQLQSLPISKQIEVHELRAKAYQHGGFHYQSADERVKMDPLLSNQADKSSNHNAIWTELMAVSTGDLERYSENSSKDMRGWVNLAYRSKVYGTQPKQMDVALGGWQQDSPDDPPAVNPAADPESPIVEKPAPEFVPQESNESSTFSSNRENETPPANPHSGRIALLLPMTGKLKSSAEAVRDGFMSAFYQSTGNRDDNGVSVFDTESDKNVTAAIEKALDSGANFIVGPLTKQGVTQLQKTRTGEIPVLALNYTDPGYSRGNVFQFGLAPEDEAKQAVALARNKGYQNAIVLAQNNAWGTRVGNAFIHEWEAQGGKILKSSHIEKNLSNTVSRMLEVNTSQDRANNVKRLSDKKDINFAPRRRQDIDVIFLATYPVEARQIKPLLAFYYAADVPVYATSSVYAGARNPKVDRDLNGVVFCDSPAILQNTSQESNLAPEEAGNKARLYALGVDAFKLIPQLNNLSRSSEMHFSGASGQLFLDRNGQIIRQLPCAQFKNGVPTPIG